MNDSDIRIWLKRCCIHLEKFPYKSINASGSKCKVANIALNEKVHFHHCELNTEHNIIWRIWKAFGVRQAETSTKNTQENTVFDDWQNKMYLYECIFVTKEKPT